MKFKIKNPEVNERNKWKFAIFPVRIGNTIIWMEYYLSVQVYEYSFEYSKNRWVERRKELIFIQ